MVVCKVCGTQNEQGASFCGSCGAFLEWNGEPVAPDGSSAAATPPPVPPGPPADQAATTVVTTPVVPQTPATPPVTDTAAADATAGMLICPNCGQANEPTRTFCRRCATELAPVVAAQPLAATPPPGRSIPPVALLGGGAAAILLAAIALFVILPRGATAPPVESRGTAPPVASASPLASGGQPSASDAAPSASTAADSPSPPPVPTGSIVFTATKNGDADVWVWSADDQSQHTLVTGAGNQSDAAWSGDGSQVVYRTKDGLRLVNADGSPVKAADFTHHGQDRNPAWSHGGKSIAFSSDRPPSTSLDIYTRPLSDTTALHRLTTNSGDDWDPTWSKDGSTIAFVSVRNSAQHLYQMAADGSKETEIKLGSGVFDDPIYSPDGEWLAYTWRAKTSDPKELWVAHTDGSDKRKVFGGDASLSDPAWSPDSQLIAVARADAKNQIVIVDVASGTELLSFGVDGAKNQTPDWH